MKDMMPKQLIVAVEGTAAMGPHWQTIVSDYLDKIIRCFCGNDSTTQKPSPQFELLLVMFNACGPYSACLVQRSGWTKDMDIFFEWLSAIPFAGGGFNDAAIAEGLAEALMMLCSPNVNQNQNLDPQKHCILVAANNPYPLPTPVYRPPSLEQSDAVETKPNNCLCDAESLAKYFGQYGISLSVICPRKLPKLKAIYTAGKRNPRAADLAVDNAKNPYFLVLIPENFMEARVGLTRSGMANLPSNQNPVKMDVTPTPPISGPAPTTAVPSANGTVLNRQPMPVGKSIPQPVKVEPTTVPSATAASFPHVTTGPRPTSQPVPNLQTSSPISLPPQELVSNNETISQDMKPSVNTMRPTGPAANSKILNGVSAQARQVLAGAGGNSIGTSSIGGSPMLTNMISSGLATSVPPSQTVMSSTSSGVTSMATSQVVQNSGSAASTVVGNSSHGMSQPLSNLQVSGGMGQTLGGISQVSSIPVQQMVPTGMNINQNGQTASGSSGVPAGSGNIMPTPGMPQQIQGMQPVGVNSNNSVGNMSLNPQSSNTMQAPAQSKYVKVWEGNLSGQRQGQPVFITRLEGYRSASASETLAANWPPTMQIVRLISQDHMNNKQYVGKADFLVFRAMDQHGFLGQLQEKKLCAVIQLPSQTLLLSVSDKAYRLIGMLFPGDMVVFKPQIPNQQQQQQLQAQQQHIQQMQQQQPQQQQQQQMQQQQQPQIPQMQQQSGLPQMQQQSLPQIQQQQPLMQMQQQPLMQLQQQQQIPQMQQQQTQQQQMVGTGMNQGYMQGAGRSQMLGQGPVSSQGAPTMSGGNFMS